MSQYISAGEGGARGITLTCADREIWDEIKKHAPRAWPSARLLAERTGYTVRTVRRTILKLRSLGYRIESRWRPNGSQTTNIYHIPEDLAEARRISYAKAAAKARRERNVTPPRSNRKKQPNYVRLAGETRRRSPRPRQRWRLMMGEVVQFDSGLPDKPNATPGQALFTAVVDSFSSDGVRIPRSQIAIAVKHGAAALKDEIDPRIVLAGCVTSLRRGRPELASRIILDISLAAAGQLMNTHEYNRELKRISTESNPVQKRFADAMRAITEGRGR